MRRSSSRSAAGMRITARCQAPAPGEEPTGPFGPGCRRAAHQARSADGKPGSVVVDLGTLGVQHVPVGAEGLGPLPLGHPGGGVADEVVQRVAVVGDLLGPVGPLDRAEQGLADAAARLRRAARGDRRPGRGARAGAGGRGCPCRPPTGTGSGPSRRPGPCPRSRRRTSGRRSSAAMLADARARPSGCSPGRCADDDGGAAAWCWSSSSCSSRQSRPARCPPRRRQRPSSSSS